MRRIAVATSGRQDYGILRSTCRLLQADPRFELQLFVMGMHLAEAHGMTVRAIESDGLPIARRLETFAKAPAEEAAATVRLMSAALAELTPEALILVGNRSETAAAALAATLARVPIIHVHGGEETEGAIDNLLRHAITKLAHLHLVTHPDHAQRVAQMAEDPRSITVVGAPGLDNLHRTDLPTRDQLSQRLGITLTPPVVAVTFHPTTLGAAPEEEATALVAAMRQVQATYVITLPNNDAGAEPLRRALRDFASSQPGAVAVEALGEAGYFALLRDADAVLGNSSSALIEAPVFQLPAVNVGDRQKGRLRGANVIDASLDSIAEALRRALSPELRASLIGTTSPYGDGHSGARIVEALASWQPPRPPRKRFFPSRSTPHG